MFRAKCYIAFIRLCLMLAGVVWATVDGSSIAAAQNTAGTSPFGPNVIIVNPSMSPAAINSLLNTANQEAQFSTNRYAVLFQPGTYGTTSNPVTAQVGFYEQISGLGKIPDGVTITGGFYADQLINGNMTQNFWRSQENMAEIPVGGLTNGVLDWGVSQGASLRRMNIEGGLWLANSGPIGSANACQESSGGYMADTQVYNVVNACSQQQWYTRNSFLPGGFTGFVWNFVFSGVMPRNTPAASYPGGPGGDTNVTNLPTTPVSQEKPFLYMDNSGNYNVFIPNLQTNSFNTSWSGGGMGPGYSLPLSSFYIATPSSTLVQINQALASGLSLILTPGIYKYSDSIHITQGATVVLGMGYATLVPQTGTPAITVADVGGVVLAGLLIDAGPVNSPVLLEVGSPGVVNNRHASEPTVLNDIFFRIGGATAGSATTTLQVDSGDVILDNIWAWRADHGNPGTFGWTVNTAAHGVVVNGSNVTALGLAVEHFQQEQVLWNGDKGETIFYQSELPYDPPNQAAWTNGTQNGYPSYVVTPGSVCTHTAYGLGIYSFFNLGVNIIEDNAMTVPTVTGVNITDVGTVFLNGSGEIRNIINGVGGVASSANSGKLDPLAAYDAFGTCTATTPPVGSTVPLQTISSPNPNNWDTANIMKAIKTPHPDLVVIATHRGLHSLAGTNPPQAPDVPENSLTSIKVAAQAGWELVEVDVRMTSDGIPILSHDRSWGRETCTTQLATLDGVPYDPWIKPDTNPTNDAKNPDITAVTKDRMRWYYADNTVLRDNVSLPRGNNGFYTHGCSNTGHSIFAGEFAPTLQEALDYIKKNKIQMVFTLDVQSIAAAKASWNVVLCGTPTAGCSSPGPDNADSWGRPFSQSTIFKMPAGLFPNGPTDFVNTFGSNYAQLNYMPVIVGRAIEPRAGDALVDNAYPDGPDDDEDGEFDVVTAGFGSEQAIIKWLHDFETYNITGPISISGVEIVLKQTTDKNSPPAILQSVLDAAWTWPDGSPMTVANFNPVGDFYPPDNSNPNQTPNFFVAKDGHCCYVLSNYWFNNPDGTGPKNPNLPMDTADNRTDLGWITSLGFQFITTDNPSALAKALGTGKRHTCYLKQGYTGGTCSATTTAAGPTNGTYTITNANSGLAMDVPGGSTATGVAIEQWTPNGGSGQQWQVTHLSDGTYQLTSVISGLCLDVNGGSTQIGATMDQYTCHAGYTNQKFTVSATSDGNYTIVASNSGLAVEIPGGATEPGTVLEQWTPNGTKPQEWVFRPAVPATGRYTIANASSGLAMDVAGNSTANSAAVDQWTPNSGSNQKWQLTFVSNGLYQLISVNSGLCLDVNAGSLQTGATLDQYTCNTTYLNQLFTLSPAGGGNWTLVVQKSGLAVEVPGSSTTPGTVLDQWTINQGKNQAWTFTPTN